MTRPWRKRLEVCRILSEFTRRFFVIILLTKTHSYICAQNITGIIENYVTQIPTSINSKLISYSHIDANSRDNNVLAG